VNTSPTAQVLAQWDDWSSNCTDRLFDLDARVATQGSADDRLDIAAVFVARKAIVDRIEAMRAAQGRDERTATALAAQPLLDEQGGLVANDLTAGATLVDAVLGRIEGHLAVTEAREGEIARSIATATADLAEAAALAESLGQQAKQVAELHDRQAATAREAVSLTALAVDAHALLVGLRAADAERTRVLAALPDVPAKLTALRTRETVVRALVDEVRTKVVPVPNLAVPAVDALGATPSVDALPWPAARAQLEPYLSRLDRVGAALDEVERRFRTALERRNDLRGLLQAYRDKADAHRLGEDPRLEPKYQAARDVLWSAPCDLEVAAPLVTAFTDAVNATIGGTSATDPMPDMSPKEDAR